eukprot:CAMPEP_0179126780 /NCGR_PEP_ID=MMETSP0796-20121207/60027_1 /TAXON_ID=73915 /ORGANISM="Pyrodinium bahamense, Strain pbaha01" /LENGTH=80 /DNA_ID=CAMNT_0020825543 /DNA_START=33 /DNA_END=273 /DNA_ORIENTATION=+
MFSHLLKIQAERTGTCCQEHSEQARQTTPVVDSVAALLPPPAAPSTSPEGPHVVLSGDASPRGQGSMLSLAAVREDSGLA